MRKFIENICGAIEESYKSGNLVLLIAMFLMAFLSIVLVGCMILMELTDWNSNACLSVSMFVSLFMFTAFLFYMTCYSEE